MSHESSQPAQEAVPHLPPPIGCMRPISYETTDSLIRKVLKLVDPVLVLVRRAPAQIGCQLDRVSESQPAVESAPLGVVRLLHPDAALSTTPTFYLNRSNGQPNSCAARKYSAVKAATGVT